MGENGQLYQEKSIQATTDNIVCGPTVSLATYVHSLVARDHLELDHDASEPRRTDNVPASSHELAGGSRMCSILLAWCFHGGSANWTWLEGSGDTDCRGLYICAV
jgi:hypothetical protein